MSQTSLSLRLTSPDGDQGFPGTVTAEVTYSVTEDSLRLDYAATCDAPTVINLTNHIYFNLAGSGSVLQQQLQLNADAMTPTDAQQIPTGEIAAVAGTPFDFRTAGAIGARVDSDDAAVGAGARAGPQFRAEQDRARRAGLGGRGCGIPKAASRLELSTTEPGIQVYSTNNVKPGQLNADGREIQKRDGLALETQHFPDSPEQAGFPFHPADAGRTFRSTTIFRFTAA